MFKVHVCKAKIMNVVAPNLDHLATCPCILLKCVEIFLLSPGMANHE